MNYTQIMSANYKGLNDELALILKQTKEEFSSENIQKAFKSSFENLSTHLQELLLTKLDESLNKEKKYLQTQIQKHIKAYFTEKQEELSFLVRQNIDFVSMFEENKDSLNEINANNVLKAIETEFKQNSEIKVLFEKLHNLASTYLQNVYLQIENEITKLDFEKIAKNESFNQALSLFKSNDFKDELKQSLINELKNEIEQKYSTILQESFIVAMNELITEEKINVYINESLKAYNENALETLLNSRSFHRKNFIQTLILQSLSLKQELIYLNSSLEVLNDLHLTQLRTKFLNNATESELLQRKFKGE